MNDPVLEPLLRAADDASAEGEIERILVGMVEPVARRILARYPMLSSHDLDDISATVMLRLIAKLRALRSGDEAVQDLENYIATTTYNLINDHIRRRFPERARLKSRLRYLLTHDPRFAVWPAPNGSACGFREWLGREDTVDDLGVPEQRRLSAIGDPNRAAEAVAEIFRFSGRPVLLDAVVAFLAEMWNVTDTPPPLTVVEGGVHHDATAARVETRQLLGALWREIRELRPMQRRALLLNLRDNSSVNVTSLIVLTGTAGYDDLAEALEMTPEELAALWNDLPLDDLRIAGLLDVTRQQVINLRKSARARLSRRLWKYRNKAVDSTS